MRHPGRFLNLCLLVWKRESVTNTYHDQPKQQAFAQLHDGLRMGALFEFVVTRGPLRYERQMFQRVFWASSEKEDHPVWKRNPGLVEAFQQASVTFDLVVYQIAARGCLQHKVRITEEEKMRRLMFSSYAELNQEKDAETYDVVDVEEEPMQTKAHW